jgi:hypothetical protein
MMQQQQLL